MEIYWLSSTVIFKNKYINKHTNGTEKTMKIKITLLIATLLISGCSTLSPEVRNIEVYNLKFRIPSACEKLGEVKATAGTLMGQQEANAIAVDNLKQKAYDTYHANTLYIRSAGRSFGTVNYQGYAEGIAYNCPK